MVSWAQQAGRRRSDGGGSRKGEREADRRSEKAIGNEGRREGGKEGGREMEVKGGPGQTGPMHEEEIVVRCLQAL